MGNPEKPSTIEKVYRDLTPIERAFVTQIIERSGASRKKELLAEVPALKVISRCTCGCPSIDFGTHEGHERGADGMKEAVSATATLGKRGGCEIGVLVDGGGKLYSLDVWSHDPDAGPFILEEIENVRFNPLLSADS